MNKAQRTKVWERYNHHCAYCGKVLEYKDMQVDHMIPRRQGRAPHSIVDRPENLMPSCRRCNHYKRSKCLRTFRRLIMTIDQRIKNTYIAKVADDYGIVEYRAWDGVFYFEKIEYQRLNY